MSIPTIHITRMERQHKSSPSYTLILFDFFFFKSPINSHRHNNGVCRLSVQPRRVYVQMAGEAVALAEWQRLQLHSAFGASGDHLHRLDFLYSWSRMRADRGGVTQQAQSQSQFSTGKLDLTSCWRFFFIKYLSILFIIYYIILLFAFFFLPDIQIFSLTR